METVKLMKIGKPCKFINIKIGDFFIISNAINEVPVLKISSIHGFPLKTIHFKDTDIVWEAYHAYQIDTSTKIHKLQKPRIDFNIYENALLTKTTFEKLDVGTLFYSNQRGSIVVKTSFEDAQKLPLTMMRSYNSLRLTYKFLNTSGLVFMTEFPDFDKITGIVDPICLTEFSDDSEVMPLSEVGFSFKKEENKNGFSKYYFPSPFHR